MMPILQVGPAAIPTAPLVLLIGFWIAWSLAERTAKVEGVSANQISNLILIVFASGIIGARIGYAVNHPIAFSQNIWSLFSLRPSMLDIGSGLLIAFMAGVIFLNRTRLPIWSVLDALTPPAGIMAMAISLANFASGSTYGIPTTVPWSITLWGADRHPVQLYAFVLFLVVFLLTYPWKNQPSLSSGVRFCTFTAFTSLAIIIADTFRGDSHLLIGNLRTSHVLALSMLVASVIFLIRYRKKENDD